MTVPTFAALAASLGFAGAMVWAGTTDFMTMKIHNGLILALLFAYGVLAPAIGFDLGTIGWSVVAACSVLLFSFLLFARGWIGGGDAKLAAVTALWLGAEHTLSYLLYIAVLGGVLSVLLLGFRRVKLPSRWHDMPWLARLHEPTTGVPYGVAMAPAALLVFPHTAWTAAL